MNDNIKQQLCREDFYLMMENACAQAGGGNLKKLRDMKLHDVVDILAHNGIRMVYMPEKHMNSVNITWGGEKAITDGNPPKKKQLLCDQKEIDDAWNELHT